MRSQVLLSLAIAAAACSSKKRREDAPPTPVAGAPAAPAAGAAPAQPSPTPPAAPLPALAADPGGATGASRWTTSFGGLGIDAPRGLAIDEQGIALAGLFSGEATFGPIGAKTAAGKTDAMAMALDDTGTPKWLVSMGGVEEDVANAVALKRDRMLVAGNFAGRLTVRGADGAAPLVSDGPGSDDLFAVCLDRNGAALWAWTAGGRDSDGANTVAATADGWLVGGSFSGQAEFGTAKLTSRGATDAMLIKLSADGDVQWVKQFGGRYKDAIWRVATDPAGNIFVQGIFADVADWGGGPLRAGGGSDNDVVLAKYDAAGNHLWSKRFGSAFNEVAGGVAVDPAGYVTMTGSFDQSIDFGAGAVPVAGESDVYVARFAPNGDLVWANTYGASREDIGFGIAVDSTGNVVVSGWFQQTVDFGGGAKASYGSRDVFVLKLDIKGKHVWSTTFGDRDHDQARAIALDGKGRPMVAGIYRFDLSSGTTVHSVHSPTDKAPPPDIFLAAFER